MPLPVLSLTGDLTDHTTQDSTKLTSDQTIKGILTAFAAFLIYSLSDASVKLIEGGLSPYESAFLGSVFGLSAIPFMLKRGDRWTAVFETRKRRLWLMRFIATGIGTAASVTAFTLLPMAEAFALIFLLPSFVTILSVITLREKVGVKRWSAVVIGFAGVLVVLRPGFRELGTGHVAALVTAIGAAVNIIGMRAAGPGESRAALYGSNVLGVLIICGIAMAPVFAWPTTEQWLLLAGYGLLAALANVLLMIATQSAPAAYIGPTQYSQMLWGILLGYLIFGDGVDAPMIAGMALIVVSGLLTLWREKAKGIIS